MAEIVIDNKKAAVNSGYGAFYEKVMKLFISLEQKSPPRLRVRSGILPSVCLEWNNDLIFHSALEQLPKISYIRVDGIVRSTGVNRGEQFLEIMFEPSEIIDSKISEE